MRRWQVRVLPSALMETAGLQDKRRPAILFFVACLVSYHGSYHNGISKTQKSLDDGSAARILADHDVGIEHNDEGVEVSIALGGVRGWRVGAPPGASAPIWRRSPRREPRTCR